MEPERLPLGQNHAEEDTPDDAILGEDPVRVVEQLVYVHAQTPPPPTEALDQVLPHQERVLLKGQRRPQHGNVVVAFEGLNGSVGGAVVQEHHVLYAQRAVVLDEGLHVRSAVANQAHDDELLKVVGNLLGSMQVLYVAGRSLVCLIDRVVP